MKIVIASGIFEPEGGGPATYAPRLAEKLIAAGHAVTVVTLSSRECVDGDEAYPFQLVRVARGNRVFGRARLLRALLSNARTADLIYSLDWYGVGILVACAAWWRHIPTVFRVGGDYVWEQRYLLRAHDPLPLAEFYESGEFRAWRYRGALYVIRFVLSHASHVLFNTDRERLLYERYFGIVRTSTIPNPVPKEAVAGIVRDGASTEIVFWGRFTAMKNIASLVRAFGRARVPASYRLVLIGDGPLFEPVRALVRESSLESRVEMIRETRFLVIMERIKNARAFVLPSWTDISPTQVYEALAIGLPALVTKENYLPIREQLPSMIDPRSLDDIAAKLEMLADDDRYTAFARSFRSITFNWNWNDVVREHLALFERVTGIHGTGIRVLQIGSDRSKRGILFPGSPAYTRQEAYARHFGALDIIGYSLTSDGARASTSGNLRIFPTNSPIKVLYGTYALLIARKLPRPDVVSAQDPFESGLLALLIARLLHVPLHVQVHTDFLSPEYARHSFANRIRIRIARFVLRRAARIRVVSERIKTSIEKQYHPHAPITVLPIFVDVEKFRAASTDPELEKRFSAFKTKLLVVSRLEPEKQVELALKAFAVVARNDACLVVVGTGSASEYLKTLARTLSIADRIFFEGEQDAAKYYPLADLVLVTSRYEGYGLVIIEALAAGKPVLSTDVGVAREAGVVVSSEEAFAEDLKEWFEKGSRHGQLLKYPYNNFAEYVDAYCEDIKACALTEKQQ